MGCNEPFQDKRGRFERVLRFEGVSRLLWYRSLLKGYFRDSLFGRDLPMGKDLALGRDYKVLPDYFGIQDFKGFPDC